MGKKGGRRGKGGAGRSKKAAGAKGKTSKRQQSKAEERDVYDEGEVDFSKIKPVDDDDSDPEYALDSDNDEDIDSDAAFDEEDEKVFEDLTNQGKVKATKAKGQAASKPSHPTLDLLDEDEDDNEGDALDDGDGEEDDADDLVDLSELLTRGEANNDNAAEHGGGSVAQELLDDDEDNAREEDLDEEEEEERYNKVVEGFHNMSRRLVDRKERTETEAPSMMNVVGTASTDKVSMSDLLGALGKESKKVSTLKKKLAPLQAQEKKMRLDTPLGTATKSKIARQTAFQHAADKASRWEPIVRENRRAERLSFVEEPASKTLMSTVAALTSKFKPKKGIEEEIAKALKESKAEEKRNSALTEAESLALKALSPREAEERVRELASMKALNSYYEAKCRRMKKIKSKKYRKIRRKAQRHLDEESMAELDDDDRKDRLLKQERQRAQERLTLKHRGKGKWAKRMLSRGNIDADTRRALNDQQRIARDLLQKTAGDSDDDDDDGSDFDESKETVEEAVQKLERDLQKKPQVASGIEGMKFMQQAVEQQREEAQQMLRELKAELHGRSGLDEEETSHRFTMAPSAPGAASKTSKAEEEQVESQRKRSSKRRSGVDTHDDYDDNNDDSARQGDDSDGEGEGEGEETNAPKKGKSSDEKDTDEDVTPRFRGRRRVRASGAVEVSMNGDSVGAVDVTSVDMSGHSSDGDGDGDNEAGDQTKAKGGEGKQTAQRGDTGEHGAGKKGRQQNKQTGKASTKKAADAADEREDTSRVTRSQARKAKANGAGDVKEDGLDVDDKAAPASKKAKGSKGTAAPAENAYLAALFGKGDGKAKSNKEKEEEAGAGQGGRAEAEGDNPWLTAVSSDAGLTPELVITSKSKKGEKQLAKAQTLRKKAHKGSAPQLTELEAKADASDKSAAARKKSADEDLVLDEEEAAQDATEGHKRLDLSKATHANKKLIQQAFAADDVLVKEFEREKAEIAQEETVKDKVTLMPGWGDWAGHGISNTRRSAKRIVKKAPKQKKRRDAALKKVIISEKQDRKLNKRRLADIPHPFDNPQHFEKTMQNPVGREWNTDGVFRSNVRPAVETQAGAIIEPMKMTKGGLSEAKRKFEAKTGEDLTPKRLQSGSKSRHAGKGNRNKKRGKHGKKQAAK